MDVDMASCTFHHIVQESELLTSFYCIYQLSETQCPSNAEETLQLSVYGEYIHHHSRCCICFSTINVPIV